MLRDPSALSAERTELKYLLAREAVGPLKARLDQELSPQHHGSAESALAALAQHYTTTVYFDTEARALYRAARNGGEHTKLRAREYYDVLPLAEHATHFDELLRHNPVLWIELKQRTQDQTRKLRVGVPKKRLPRFLESGLVDEELLRIQREAHGTQGDYMLAHMLRFFETLDGPLRVSAIVTYRRAAWQDPQGLVRVTLDEELAVFAPSQALWQEEAPLTRERLGVPRYRETRVVAEVKLRARIAPWLEDALVEAGAQPVRYSKFVQASEALTLQPGG